jgi:hypothetical protein
MPLTVQQTTRWCADWTAPSTWTLTHTADGLPGRLVEAEPATQMAGAWTACATGLPLPVACLEQKPGKLREALRDGALAKRGGANPRLHLDSGWPILPLALTVMPLKRRTAY